MITPKQKQALNRLQPGQTLQWSDDLLLLCRATPSDLSGCNCCNCCLHLTRCDGVACLAGQGPADHPRTTDVYFLLQLLR